MGIEVALLASAVIGGVSSLRASDRAADAAAEQTALGEEGLSLQREQQDFNEARYNESQNEYNEWKEVYGPLQEDVVDYYKNLTGESLSNTQVTRIQEANQAANDKIARSMAQSGRDNSGLSTAMMNQNIFNAEIQKAEARNSADAAVADAKTQFLNVGLQQASNIKATQAGISSSMQSNVTNQATSLQNMGSQAVAAAGTQNQISASYTNDIQSLLGYGSRYYQQTATTPAANTVDTTGY